MEKDSLFLEAMRTTHTFNRQFRRITFRQHDDVTGKIIHKFRSDSLTRPMFEIYSEKLDRALNTGNLAEYSRLINDLKQRQIWEQII